MTTIDDDFSMDMSDEMLDNLLPPPPIPDASLPVMFNGDAVPVRHMELNVVYQMTPEEIAQMNFPNRKATPPGCRASWPFKTMAMYDRVCISVALAAKAQTAAHVYGARTGKQFTTARLPNKTLVVTRVK
jgi:hypothetical protein